MPPSNVLPIHGNEKTMNLNTLILTNIQSSPYFKVQLYELKTYHQVIDEIYTRVGHLEPWEKGSRKTAGQTGMCGGVRGVGAGGIVSSCFCLLYKLYTLKLTRKQLIGLCTHTDSPYIRGIGLMYARFTQPPGDLWEWFEPYLDDEEEIDVKAGGGHVMTIGEVANHFLTKLEWYSTLFPRIPVPIQKQIEHNLLARKAARTMAEAGRPAVTATERSSRAPSYNDTERVTHQEDRAAARVLDNDSREEDRSRPDMPRRSPIRDRRSPNSADCNSHVSNSQRRSVERDRERRRSRSAEKQSHHSSRRQSVDRDRHSRHRSTSRRRSVERDSHHRSRSQDKHSHRNHRRSPDREKSRRHADRSSHNHRSRSRSQDRHRSHSRQESRSKSDHPSRVHKSPKRDAQQSPNSGDPFERALQKELERVRRSKVDEQENGK